MRTKQGRLLTAEQFNGALGRLMQRPVHLDVECYCKWPQVPRAHLNPQALEVRRLSSASVFQDALGSMNTAL